MVVGALLSILLALVLDLLILWLGKKATPWTQRRRAVEA
jgi:ABC-type proline/glycine betaine transport system permease subunit